jgi:DegT/DnrJ/EryC1/StrS aminotransferase family protein
VTACSGNGIGGGDWSEDRIVPDTIRAFERGSPVRVRNPASVRPWQHVLDPLAGYLALGSHLAVGGAEFCGPWNFGQDSGNLRTVRDVVEEVSLGIRSTWTPSSILAGATTPGSDPSWFGFLLTVRPEAPFSRDDVVRELESRKIQARMLFAGNLVRQPSIVYLARDRREASGTSPYRAIGDLANTDEVMNRAFWFGVYPGLTPSMLEYVAETIRRFARSR